MVKDHRSSENKSGYMLGHPVDAPVLATRSMRPKKVAVKIRCGRAISRKGRTSGFGILRDCMPDRTLSVRMRQSVLHGNMQSTAEMTVPVTTP